MKKSSYLLASGIALGLAVTPALAQQSTTRPFIDYAGIGLALSQVSDLSDGTALVANAGKNIRGLPGLSVEGEFTTTLSKPESNGSDVTYWTLGGYGVYTLPVTQMFDLRGRLGALYEDVNYTEAVGGPRLPGDRTELKLSGGVGATFHVTPRVGITADYTRIDEDINHIGAGVQFNF